MYHTQENIIFCSTHTIFDKKFFPKYTKSCVKEYKLYNKLLNKISWEIELLVSRPFSEDKPALLSIPYISISPIQNNSPCFLSLSLSYKSPSLLPLPVSKKPIVKVEKVDDIEFNVEIWSLSPQQLSQLALQIL